MNAVCKLLTKFCRLLRDIGILVTWRRSHTVLKKQIKDQFAKFVHPKYVTGGFKIDEEKKCVVDLLFRRLLTPVDVLTFMRNGLEQSGTESALKCISRPRWKEKSHIRVLVNIIKEHFYGKAPKSGKECK